MNLGSVWVCISSSQRTPQQSNSATMHWPSNPFAPSAWLRTRQASANNNKIETTTAMPAKRQTTPCQAMQRGRGRAAIQPPAKAREAQQQQTHCLIASQTWLPLRFVPQPAGQQRRNGLHSGKQQQPGQPQAVPQRLRPEDGYLAPGVEQDAGCRKQGGQRHPT
ncbi:hypothetical protein D3C78_1432830 [compost metagenome]